MFTSNLKSLPMKKQWRHFVSKLSLIFWIFLASTSWPSLGIYNSGKTGSSVITDESLSLFDRVVCRLADGVVCRLAEGIGVLLSAGVEVVLVLLESAGTSRGFLTYWGLEDPAPSSVVAFCLTGCCAFGLFCNALLKTVIACFNFVNLLATLVFDVLPSMKMASGFMVSGSTHVSLAYKGSKASVNWCMNMCTFCTAEFSRMTSTCSLRAWTDTTSHPVSVAQVCWSWVPLSPQTITWTGRPLQPKRTTQERSHLLGRMSRPVEFRTPPKGGLGRVWAQNECSYLFYV